jgi:diguanylate cyclase (GGDEF)-like protein
MSQDNPKKNNRLIFILAFLIAVLILVNGAFAYWQMQQVKQEFDDVANRDLPLIAQLLPLIDRQFEQTLLIAKLDKLSFDQQSQIMPILEGSFFRTGDKFVTTLGELNRFIAAQIPLALMKTQIELSLIKTILGNIGKEHRQYQMHVLQMFDGIKGNSAMTNSSTAAKVSNQEKKLTAQLLGLRDQVQQYTQQSANAVEAHETLVIQETATFTLFVFSLGSAMLFLISQVMMSRNKAVEELTYFATFDSLTKLFNRRYFFERLEQAIKTATRHKQQLSVCVCDLDHFKQINDTFGHQAGDLALTEFSQILLDQIRADDVAGRFGGDEFILFLPNTDANSAIILLERVRVAVAAKVFDAGEGKYFSVTASFGVVELSDEQNNSTLLLELADKALFAAKEHGRDQVLGL